jgi:hypothetical protein
MNHVERFRQKLDSGRLCLGPAITLSDAERPPA